MLRKELQEQCAFPLSGRFYHVLDDSGNGC
jgi:hypothetical protein